jgi:hypothetical protein
LLRIDREQPECVRAPAWRHDSGAVGPPCSAARGGGQCGRTHRRSAGPRSPPPGAPYTYVTTKQFLSHFGFDTLRNLPDMEQFEEAGLLSKQKLLAGALPGDLSEAQDLINIEERAGEDLEADEPPLALSSEDL